MQLRRSWTAILAGLALFGAGNAAAQSAGSTIHLVVQAGTPLRVALDEKVKVTKTGQQVTATLLDPVYAYDRIVVPSGTKVSGHIERIETLHGAKRARAMIAGDFTPPRYALVAFDRLVAADGRTTAIQTSASAGRQNVALRVADSKEPGAGARAREEAARQAKQAIAVITAPGKLERLKDAAIDSLPYHPTYLRKGTVYTARLSSALDFGEAVRTEPAAAGSAPAPDSILNARLVTPLDSVTSARGTRVEARLTQPVFSTDHRLVLPEGTALRGEVTLSKPARRFHRNGKLRFLFESIQVPDAAEQTLLGSLHSVESERGSRIAIDEEGTATSTNSSARFIAPAVGALALAASLSSHLDYDTDGAGPETAHGQFGSGTVGGFLGFAALGAALAQVSRPIALALAAAGLVRTAYSAIAGRGRNISFPTDTSIQIRLAPGPGAANK